MNSSLTRVLAGLLMLASILLVWNQVAMAALEDVEESIEVATDELRLWQLNANVLAVRRCTDCRLELLRVDADTRFCYRGAGSIVGRSGEACPRLDDSADLKQSFREAFLQRAREADGRAGMVSLFVSLDSNYIRRLRLSPRPGASR